MTVSVSPSATASELGAAIAACRNALIGVGVASFLVNLLMLTGPLFMLQIYDRVLPSRSTATLAGLALLALMLFAFQGVLDTLRGRMLLRIGGALDERMSARVFDVVMRRPLQARSTEGGLQTLRDLDTVRTFFSSAGLTALFDLPWTPLYVAICFAFHPWFGLAVFGGVLGLCALTVLTEVLTRGPSREMVGLATARYALAEAARRNATLLQGLGMRRRMAERWTETNAVYLRKQRASSDIVADLGSLSRVLRMVLQCAVLGLGAYLVIYQEATAGVMLAATILASRALAPVELAIANWRAFVAARQGWRRLSESLAATPKEEIPVALPRPSSNLRVASLSVAPPEHGGAVLHEVSFTLEAGSAVAVIGPSGSGKSSLARALIGAWKPVRGAIRLDGATLDQWSSDSLGSFIGYLPQEVELFEGTVAQNISRFEQVIDARALIAAARAAGVHDIILRLPKGYEAQVGEGGALLSGGQRQRIALARALYREPFLVVLDEPNSHLDANGEHALAQAIGGIRARGGIAVVIAHRPSILSAADQVLVLNEGRMQAFGACDQIVQQAVRPWRAPAAAVGQR